MRFPRAHRSVVAFLLSSLALFAVGRAKTPEPAGLSPKTAAAIRAFTTATMKEWHIAGAAVGVIKDGRVVFLEGFGLRDVAQKLPVTPRTKFILGSTTKAFTTAALGLLVADKKLDWDEPVAAYLPEFGLRDEYASAHATVRDLAAHRTGLPRHDFVWVNSPMTLPEMVRSLRFLEPSRELRAAFQYNNLMYIVLGLLVEKVSGMPWEDFVRERIFKPLGMTRSGCTIPEHTAAEEYALSYRWEKDAWAARPFPVPTDRLMYGGRASGSINTTAEDFCLWALAHLQAEQPDAKLAIPAEALRRTHMPQITTPWNPASNPEVLTPSYALGWMVDVYRNHWRVHHGGSTLDFNSSIVLFPSERLGIVLHINASSPANTILAYGLSDLALGLSPVDWSKKYAAQFGAQADEETAAPRVEGTKPAHPLAEYAGEYVHPSYGLIAIAMKGDRLEVDYKGFVSPLEHWHFETFNLAAGDLEGQKLTFRTDAAGKVASVSGAFEPAVDDIVFKRR